MKRARRVRGVPLVTGGLKRGKKGGRGKKNENERWRRQRKEGKSVLSKVEAENEGGPGKKVVLSRTQ